MPEVDPRNNSLLRTLPATEYDRLRPRLEVVESTPRDQVYAPGKPVDQVYFPLGAVFSMVALVAGEVAVEVGTIGTEGMVGLPVFLGAVTSPNAAFCQIAGPSARLSAEGLRAALVGDGALHQTLHRFTQATMVQLSQNVACNSVHVAGQRAARWLLTTQDRVGRDEFELTQDFLAQMLGVRRATVSEVAGGLQSAGLIHYNRGVIAIIDRPGLQRVACECYETLRSEFDRLLGGD